MNKTIYIDIDDTICNTNGLNYTEAVPITKNIKMANKFYEDGDYVVYWTSRGSKTGINWREVTEKQFDEWGVKYHELKFGKPVYDIFIDDKNINARDWERGV